MPADAALCVRGCRGTGCNFNYHFRGVRVNPQPVINCFACLLTRLPVFAAVEEQIVLLMILSSFIFLIITLSFSEHSLTH